MGSLISAHTFVSNSVAETHALGRALGALLEVGDFVGLVGGLGMGKTVFVRGIAEGAGVSTEQVASPTFAIVYPYAGRIPIYHADFYRLRDLKELEATGFLQMGEDGAVAVEWEDRIPEAAPADRLRIIFRELAPDVRELQAEARGSRAEALLKQWASLTDR